MIDDTQHPGIDPGDPPVELTETPAESQAQLDQHAADNLPAPFGHPFGGIDLDTLRATLPAVRDGLIAALRQAARDHRAARGTVVTPEDTYPLVRRLTEADEVLGQWSRAFAEVAKEARALTEEEALTVSGAEHDGTLTASLFVPDGVGQRIAVRADYKAGDSSWDVPSLVGWLIDDEVRDAMSTLPQHPGDVPPAVVEVYREAIGEVARNVVARLIGLDGLPGLGRFTPSASAIKTLRTKLAELGRDAEAAIIAQVRTVGPRTYNGVKITREAAPTGGAS